MTIPSLGTSGPFTITGVRRGDDPRPVDIDIDAGLIVAVRVSSGVDSTPYVLLPGLVDLHTHLREPGGETAETIASGTRAAAGGGYTEVFAMPNTIPVTDTVERIEDVRRRAHGASAIVHPVAAATLGQQGDTLVDVVSLRSAGVTVFSDDGHCVDDEGLVHDLLSVLAETGGVFAQHAQSGRIVGDGVINDRVAESAGCAGWPSAGEEAVVARDIALARATGGRLHICHVSTRRTADLIRWAKSVGAPVTAEVTPHHLMLTDEDAVARGPALKVNPPLRSRDDVLAMREALRDGTIDAIGTDHAPHPAAAKERPWQTAASGLTTIETALPVVASVLTDARTGAVDWAHLTRVMSVTPARIGGLTHAGTEWEPGAAANFCVVEEGGPWQFDASQMLSRSTNMPFDGLAVRHRVVATVLGGRVTHGR
ncbi:dihydroorotase [Compostimonas suwonensis]|uniref:Dihydroorotase n=1 Tax=Compostimonas suwonensis TaxID=1048394 RepID=A0A2M9BZT8_9MICO|nr:dihydroorotase [Compostimonas suwonensis]PJJ63598.1 dihydroorotase [Compostimonas suwonensis]